MNAVIVAGLGPSDGAPAIAAIKESGRTAIVEITSLAMARDAVNARCDALIVAGNEAGGNVGEESSFILLQRVLEHVSVPVWVRGVAGPRSAAAVVAAGATGVVLDGALLLARESPLEPAVRERIAAWDGGETVVFGRTWRGYAPPGSAAAAQLKAAAGEGPDEWAKASARNVGWRLDQVWPIGQDSALAASLAQRFATTGGIVQEIGRAIDEGVRSASAVKPLSPNAPLAQSHGTRFPIVQGPMTRVSDTVEFGAAVSGGGALPFLALALMRGNEVRALLTEAAARLGGKAWGVGILGFVPPELRREQIEEIRAARPPFALIAGGRPDQALALEREGIATYLHAPSPGLLRQFLRDGSRRFVLEGRECGGHVGPRSSLILWEQACAVLLEATASGIPPAELHVLFAGGIHDARSAAAVSALAAPLAVRGVRVGVLLGTAYLFTEEAVATAAIVPAFQAEAIRCSRTVLLETGPGHEVRVSPTTFTRVFDGERRKLLNEQRPADEVRAQLEGLNAGRLRVAAKGIERQNGPGSPFVTLDRAQQEERGLYMLGQAAALRTAVTTIRELHEEIANGSAAQLERAARQLSGPSQRKPRSQPSDVAIVGMAAIVPGAADVRTFWENTLRGHDAITEVPPDRWDWRLYYDPDPKAPDKVTSKWGGFLPEIPFDPLHYGMPPTSLASIEPMHLLTLEVVRAALEDAGYRDRPFPRERTAVVLGAGGGAAQLAMGYAFRSYLPMLDTVSPGAGTEALQQCGPLLPEWTEDSFPGILLNVAAGRVANRFDLGGANYTVDAACGSSLAAAALAVRELESGAADVVVLGGADTVQNPFTYLAFSKTHAFSARGRCRPFDSSADGIVISEAVAVVILKRLADAERDGDRIYAVIKGLGASSDGRAKGLTAPRPEGQTRALERAYEKADVSPATIGYVEAHGTGTVVGDQTEIEALAGLFAEAGAAPRSCAVGSVKSLIGHTKCAAGLAGLINATLALHHRVLPPTIGVSTPTQRMKAADIPLWINSRARPWLHHHDNRPRRAGVSAFGFGGTNFHAVLEAYDRDPRPESLTPVRDWPAELLVWSAPDRRTLQSELGTLAHAIDGGARPALRDLAHSLALRASQPDAERAPRGPLLAIVAESHDDLRRKLDRTLTHLSNGTAAIHDPTGIEYCESPPCGARLAFLFPGQGAQYPEMLNDLAVAFPEVRTGIERVDAALESLGKPPVGPRIYPPPAFSDPERLEQRQNLAAAEVAQPALAAAAAGLTGLLEALGVVPDAVAGHSFGELSALQAAGVYPLEGLIELAEARGRFLREAAGDHPGTMAALGVGPDDVAQILEGIDGARAVNWNGPRQTVIAGTREAVDAASERAKARGVRAQLLPVACAFHTPLVAGASRPLTALAERIVAHAPRLPVYSNVTAAPYEDPGSIAEQIGRHLASPVRFAEMIEAMHADGVTVFVEVGPGSALTSLVGSILGDRQHVASALDPAPRTGIPGLLLTLARLLVSGVPVRLQRLTEGRACHQIDLDRAAFESAGASIPASTWLVNGSRARPANAPEPPRLGPGPALPADAPLRNGLRESIGRAPLLPASRPGTPPPSSVERNGKAHANDPEVDRVLEAFQQTMRRFVDVQRETMLRYLGSRGLPAVDPPIDHVHSNGHTDRKDRHDPKPHETNGHTNGAARKSAHEVFDHAAPRHVTSPQPASPAQADVSRAGRGGVENRLLAIVRERTGYPAEMLRLDLDLEADLGIDSIKRVEILGSLRDALGGAALSSETMDRLARARTLGAIVEQLSQGFEPAVKAAGNGHDDKWTGVKNGSAESRPREADSSTAGLVKRRLLDITEAPLPASARASQLAPGVLVVTDESRGVARALAFDLRARGYTVVRVQHGSDRDGGERDLEHADLTSPSDVASLLDRVRARGPICGIVHAMPLRQVAFPDLEPSRWSEQLAHEVRGLFLLARAAARDLETASEQGGACLVAATAMGGAFASCGTAPPRFFAGHGAIAGLMKTLAREWSTVRARVVDLDPNDPVEVLAANLVQEVLTDDSRAEVGYLNRRRVSIATIERPLKAGSASDFSLPRDAPIVVTGGARGITAVVAADLARRWRPTLLLTGTTPFPSDEESQPTAGLDDPGELKAALARGLARGGSIPSLTALEQAYQTLRREREIRKNLNALRATGATVEYRHADVRDPTAMRRLLDDWRARFGPIAGLVHGAGIIRDKLIRDKTPEMFDQVLGTKLEGALVLASLLDHDPLRFAAFFSSVAGRFGNRGQSDYSAANEALNKLAIWLDQRWSGRVVSVAWGPWSGVGMVSDLEPHLGRRGLGMIPPKIGASFLADELLHGTKGDVEIVVAGAIDGLEQKVKIKEKKPEKARAER
jgi:acyl transferase domain-containing protein/NAD(P)H-dependent flavin oxidoreductase YrpB (nitropropane dioxygenase family)